MSQVGKRVVPRGTTRWANKKGLLPATLTGFSPKTNPIGKQYMKTDTPPILLERGIGGLTIDFLSSTWRHRHPRYLLGKTTFYTELTLPNNRFVKKQKIENPFFVVV